MNKPVLGRFMAMGVFFWLNFDVKIMISTYTKGFHGKNGEN
jgi:hypothetical protein